MQLVTDHRSSMSAAGTTADEIIMDLRVKKMKQQIDENLIREPKAIKDESSGSSEGETTKKKSLSFSVDRLLKSSEKCDGTI